MSLRPVLRRFRTVLQRMKLDEAEEQQSFEKSSFGEGKKDPIAENTVVADNDQGDPNLPQDGLQHGVRDVEAVTLTWSKTTLICVFIKYVAAFRLPEKPSANTRDQHLVPVLCQCFPVGRV